MQKSQAQMVGVFNPKRLERAMQRRGMTAADLAFAVRNLSGGRLKTTESQVYKWLRGDHAPRDGAVVVVARATDVTVDSLFESDDDEEEDPHVLLRDIQHLPLALRRRIERAITGAVG